MVLQNLQLLGVAKQPSKIQGFQTLSKLLHRIDIEALFKLNHR